MIFRARSFFRLFIISIVSQKFCEIPSFVSGYHYTMFIMDPVMSQPPSSGNFIYKDTGPGHVHYNFAPLLSVFLREVNRGAGYGLEVPCYGGLKPPIE